MAQLVITKPGVYDIPIDAYHNTEICDAPSISGSGVVMLAPTQNDPYPAPMKFWIGSTMNPEREREDTAALRMGKAAHVLFLENAEIFREQFAVMPSGLTLQHKAGKQFASQAMLAGKTLLRPEAYATALAMSEAIKKNVKARAAFSKGHFEKTLVWRDSETGVWCRCRPDFIEDNPIDMHEYKTAENAGASAFSRAISTYGYHIKAFHMMEGVRQLELGDPQTFTHWVQEKTKPYLMAFHTLPPEDLEFAEVQWRAAINTFARCLKRNEWPGYPDFAQETGLTRTARAQLQAIDLSGTPLKQENDNVEPDKYTAVDRFGR